MIRVDDYLGREYNIKTYNCWHFVCDVWRDHTGVDLSEFAVRPDNRKELMTAGLSLASTDCKGKLLRLPTIDDPCIVYFARPGILSHVGVYVRGRLLHIQERINVCHQPLEQVSSSYTEIRYYK